MAQQVTMWKDTDGNAHDTEALAEQADRDIAFAKGIKAIVSDFYYYSIQDHDIANELIARREELRRLLCSKTQK